MAQVAPPTASASAPSPRPALPVNHYIRRLVATPRACNVCHRPSPHVLVSRDLPTADFFYICQSHLVDRHFATRIDERGLKYDADAAQAPTLKDKVSKEEIEKVKQEWEAREKEKKEKKEAAEKEKEKEKDEKDKKSGSSTISWLGSIIAPTAGSDGKSADSAPSKSSSNTSKPASLATSVPSSATPTKAGEHERYQLHRHFFELRLDIFRKAAEARRKKEVLLNLPSAPKAAVGAAPVVEAAPAPVIASPAVSPPPAAGLSNLNDVSAALPGVPPPRAPHQAAASHYSVPSAPLPPPGAVVGGADPFAGANLYASPAQAPSAAYAPVAPSSVTSPPPPPVPASAPPASPLDTAAAAAASAATERSFAASKLGTKEHWDDVYDRELRTYKELGEEGEVWFGAQAVDRMVRYVLRLLTKGTLPPRPSILDLGTGNGHLLFSLLESYHETTSDEPPEALDPLKMLGVDYSQASVDLATSIGGKRALGEDCGAEMMDKVRFEVGDLCDAAYAHQLRARGGENGWDLVCDKGTMDAIALSSTSHALSSYLASVAILTKPGGIALFTSCNFTEQEVKTMLTSPGKGFVLENVIPTPTFSFGGQKGSTTTTVAFRRVAA